MWMIPISGTWLNITERQWWRTSSTKLRMIQGGDDLNSQCTFLRGMDCHGKSCCLMAVFDLIIQEAVNANLKPEHMIKKVTGMRCHLDHYVFRWLSHLDPPSRLLGVTFLTGYTDALTKLFLDNAGEVGPEHVVEATICGKRHSNMAVVD
ncbi:hypothetical protein ACFX15_033350 [Malus domestica]